MSFLLLKFHINRISWESANGIPFDVGKWVGPDGNPKDNLGKFKWNVTKEGLDVFYLKDCDNYSISSIFNHASHRFFTADNASGQTLLIGGEQLQQGYAFKNGSKTFELLNSGCNINSIGDYKGTYGVLFIMIVPQA